MPKTYTITLSDDLAAAVDAAADPANGTDAVLRAAVETWAAGTSSVVLDPATGRTVDLGSPEGRSLRDAELARIVDDVRAGRIHGIGRDEVLGRIAGRRSAGAVLGDAAE